MSRTSLLFRAGLSALVLFAAACAIADETDPARSDARETRVWYLDHAGWLVRTAEHTLIFDYTGPIESGELNAGTLAPELLADQQVVLFVSHAHGDHFKRHVLKLRDQVEGLTVVMGWHEPDVGPVVVPEDGVWTDVSGAMVFALHHQFDGIPEGFFLVRSAGVTLYHSGDHGTWSDPPKETFRANIDRLAREAPSIDLAFLSSFGIQATRSGLNAGDVYTIDKLRPQVTFPMHCGGREEQYSVFADEVTSRGLPTRVGVARVSGATFHYRDGELR